MMDWIFCQKIDISFDLIAQHVPAHPQIKMEPIQTVSVPTEDLSRMVSEVNQVKSKQDMMNNKLETMKK